jgi:voltage-dependent potassium channel beta subunit
VAIVYAPLVTSAVSGVRPDICHDPKMPKHNMEYRRVGRSGLQISALSFGSWVTFSNQLNDDLALECMQAAWDNGVNFFDNAEVYAGGESEAIMGRAFAALGWKRETYVVTTKFFWGIHGGPNNHNTLNRKYLLGAINTSLDRLGLDYVDIAYCHRADPNTPIEETVWAMSDMVSRGQATYWGTSEWSADEIRAAYEIAERHHLHKPIVEQPQYHLLERDRVEREYARLYGDCGIGLTTWSPLASGLLTGKYANGIPDDSRGNLAGYEWLRDELSNPVKQTAVTALSEIAKDLGCSTAQLAIAWCAKNPNVSSVITGASKPSQVVENLAAMEVVGRLDGDVMARIDAACGITPA